MEQGYSSRPVIAAVVLAGGSCRVKLVLLSAFIINGS